MFYRVTGGGIDWTLLYNKLYSLLCFTLYSRLYCTLHGPLFSTVNCIVDFIVDCIVHCIVHCTALYTVLYTILYTVLYAAPSAVQCCIHQGLFCHDQVTPVKFLAFFNLWRILHMFLDNMELRAEKKNYSLEKNCFKNMVSDW